MSKDKTDEAKTKVAGLLTDMKEQSDGKFTLNLKEGMTMEEIINEANRVRVLAMKRLGRA